MVPTSMRSAADGVDDTSVRFLLKMALKTPEQVERPRRKEEAKEEEEEEEEEEVKHGLNADGCSSSQRRRKKRKKKKLSRWTGSHCSHRHARQALAASSVPGLRGSSGGDSRLLVRYCRK